MDGTFTNLYSPALAIAIMVAGSPTKATNVDLPTNNATSPIGVYAPNSTVVMKNNVNFTGAVVSKSLDVKNNANFTWHYEHQRPAERQQHSLLPGCHRQLQGVHQHRHGHRARLRLLDASPRPSA